MPRFDALIEFGIGETRAVVLDAGGDIAEAHIERAGDGWRAGDRREVRLTTILVPGVRGIVAADGVEALLSPLPRGVTEGAAITVEVVREAIAEAGRSRLAKAVPATGPPRAGPDLAARLAAAGHALQTVAAHGPDTLEAAGWSEAVEAALTGHVAFPGGLLTLSPTPAMTVIDVDGALAPAALALEAAVAAAATIRRFDLTGSIGIDFPTVADKGTRTAIGAALDAGLAGPFERTAVNGFGFVQIVIPRRRSSFVERLRGDPAATAALRLLRLAERSVGTGERTLTAAPVVVAWLAARPELARELERRLGTPVGLRADPALAISSVHVAAHP